LSRILDDTILLCQICENLKKNPLAVGIQGQFTSHHQVHDFSNDHVKIEFQNGLLYVHDGLVQLQGL
jgi:penicillin V acylase-like amidase (Ntn superfamily)